MVPLSRASCCRPGANQTASTCKNSVTNIVHFEHPHPKAVIAHEMYCFLEDWGQEQYRVWCDNDI